MELTEEINKIEECLWENVGLLNIAKDYCEFNSDNSGKFVALSELIEIIINKQKDIANTIDQVC